MTAQTSKTTTHPLKGKTGLMRIFNAFFYSMEGLKATYIHESAFRQEVWLALILVPLACWLPIDLVGKALMLSAILLVMLTELLNSAIEAVVDRISFEHHELAKRAKDIGSAAVFMSMMIFVVLWGAVLIQHYSAHKPH